MVEALPVAAVSEELPQLLRIRELTAQAAEAAQVGWGGGAMYCCFGHQTPSTCCGVTCCSLTANAAAALHCTAQVAEESRQQIADELEAVSEWPGALSNLGETDNLARMRKLRC
jgi:hypothetical protein